MQIEDLKYYDIPESVIRRIKQLGFSKLTEVQKLAVEKGLFEGNNLVISAPTNTGKTFIAELAALVAAKRIVNKRTFYLVPLKAIAEEKFDDFHTKYAEWGLTIALSTGERTDFDANLTEYDLIVATYEKLNALLIKNPELIRDIGVVIIDELQMIGDEERGVDLEILITRLCKVIDNPPQIIGLSATIPNAKELAEWLEAEVIETKKREIELREGIWYIGDNPIRFNGYEIKKGDFFYKEFNTGNYGIEEKFDIQFQQEQVIIFDNTQPKAEELAQNLSENLPPSNNIIKWLEKIDALVESNPLTRKLKQCMMKGVAFHHAGLLPEEKRIVEKAFAEGDLRVICATLTLGAGVNTPAKTVLFRSTRKGHKNIENRDYKNMSGRAGRMRYHDDFGRSVLIADNERDFSRLWYGYINTEAEKVETQIAKRGSLEFSILSLFSVRVCENRSDLIEFMKKTFFGYTFYQKLDNIFKNKFEQSISKQIQKLVTMGLLEETDEKIRATELGSRCAETMISPRSVDIIFQSLKQNEDKIKLTKHDDLIEPIIFLACCTPDANTLWPPRKISEIKELSEIWETKRDSYLYLPEQEIILSCLKTTQMLLMWIEGTPYSDLKHFAKQGVIKNIGENISWITKSIKRIAEPPLFDFPEELIEFLSNLSERLKYGVPKNAVEIMKLNIPAIHRHRAKFLAEKGYNSLESLIEADINELKEVKGIGNELAERIKEHVERFIKDKNERKRQYLLRRARQLGRDTNIIERLFTESKDEFAQTCAELFNSYIEIPCRFIGDISTHEPDCLIEINNERIVIECKRKTGKELVSAKEAEEILGKGAKYNPIANVTIGYPDFSVEAKQNVSNTKITLITHAALAKILILFWEDKISKEQIINILKSGEYISEEYISNHKLINSKFPPTSHSYKLD
ncbi:MAG: DEAD/DEAH box helicase [Candidatus Helarchaeota archaeon]